VAADDAKSWHHFRERNGPAEKTIRTGTAVAVHKFGLAWFDAALALNARSGSAFEDRSERYNDHSHGPELRRLAGQLYCRMRSAVSCDFQEVHRPTRLDQNVVYNRNSHFTLGGIAR